MSNYYKIISFSNFRQRTTNPFNSLVLLSSPADAVMMPELKSFTANATPEIHKEIQNYQTYICINMPSWWVCHNHTVLFIIKINHIFCNILIHYNTVWLNNNSDRSLPPSCCVYTVLGQTFCQNSLDWTIHQNHEIWSCNSLFQPSQP